MTMSSPKLPHGTRVSSLSLNRQGNLLLACCHDRIIRLFELQPRSNLPLGQARGGCDEKQVAVALAQTSKV